MAVFRRLVFAALCAGLLSGVFATVAHPIGTVPLIRKHPAKAAMVWLSNGSGLYFAPLPVPGEELVQLGGRMIGNATQYVGKPGLWIEAVEFCRSDEGVCRGSALTASVGAGE